MWCKPTPMLRSRHRGICSARALSSIFRVISSNVGTPGASRRLRRRSFLVTCLCRSSLPPSVGCRLIPLLGSPDWFVTASARHRSRSHVIDGLRRREDADGFVQLDHRPRFSPGDKVRVVGGALCDSIGLYEGMSSRERVAILLELLGRKVRVVLDNQSVEAA